MYPTPHTHRHTQTHTHTHHAERGLDVITKDTSKRLSYQLGVLIEVCPGAYLITEVLTEQTNGRTNSQVTSKQGITIGACQQKGIAHMCSLLTPPLQKMGGGTPEHAQTHTHTGKLPGFLRLRETMDPVRTNKTFLSNVSNFLSSESLSSLGSHTAERGGGGGDPIQTNHPTTHTPPPMLSPLTHHPTPYPTTPPHTSPIPRPSMSKYASDKVVTSPHTI